MLKSQVYVDFITGLFSFVFIFISFKSRSLIVTCHLLQFEGILAAWLFSSNQFSFITMRMNSIAVGSATPPDAILASDLHEKKSAKNNQRLHFQHYFKMSSQSFCSLAFQFRKNHFPFIVGAYESRQLNYMLSYTSSKCQKRIFFLTAANDPMTCL